MAEGRSPKRKKDYRPRIPQTPKKVVLFMVEGKTDKAALGLVMSRLFPRDTVRFYVMNGDIMVRSGIRPQNAMRHMSDCIKGYLASEHLLRTDIRMIIHLTDTDGAYIPLDRVFYANISGTRYLPDRIETRAVDDTKDRIRGKRAVAGYLAAQDTVFGIPYRLYYLSRNIEHTFFGEKKSITSRQKCDFADRFEDRFAGDPDGFVEFLRTGRFVVRGDYEESWEFIMHDIRSLQRHSNMHLIFDENENKR